MSSSVISEREVLSVRQEGERLVGTVVMYDQPSTMINQKGKRFREVIKPGAFSLDHNITLVYRHNDDAVYADTASGTLRLTDDGKGIHFDADLPPYAMRLREQVNGGELRGMSVGFYPEDVTQEGEVRIVKRGRLVHVAVAKHPAYPQTKLSLREDDVRKKMIMKLRVRSHI